MTSIPVRCASKSSPREDRWVPQQGPTTAFYAPHFRACVTLPTAPWMMRWPWLCVFALATSRSGDQAACRADGMTVRMARSTCRFNTLCGTLKGGISGILHLGPVCPSLTNLEISALPLNGSCVDCTEGLQILLQMWQRERNVGWKWDHVLLHC